MSRDRHHLPKFIYKAGFQTRKHTFVHSIFMEWTLPKICPVKVKRAIAVPLMCRQPAYEGDTCSQARRGDVIMFSGYLRMMPRGGEAGILRRSDVENTLHVGREAVQSPSSEPSVWCNFEELRVRMEGCEHRGADGAASHEAGRGSRGRGGAAGLASKGG